MPYQSTPAKAKLEEAEELRQLAKLTSEAGFTAAYGQQMTVQRAAERLSKLADSIERRAKQSADAKSPIAVLDDNATDEELRKARSRQSTRRGKDVHLPGWSAMAMALPNAFLRSALFSTGRSVQASNEKVLEQDKSLLVVSKRIATLKDLSLTLSGYELCQFDRRVYATCLDYYREEPLTPNESNHYIKTSFYEFSNRMGDSYGLNTHKAIRASLLRLSFAQLRMRYKQWNLEIPKLLSANFEDDENGAGLKGKDIILLRITDSVAELFGAGAWTAVDKEALNYDGLQGWLASFYAGHAKAAWLPIETLYKISGYESKIQNFKASLVRALEKLKNECTPYCSRVSSYHISDDGKNLMVIREAWNKAVLTKPS